MKYQSLIVLLIFLLIASVGFGQGVGGGAISVQTVNGGRFSGSAGFMAPRFLPPAVLGAPYSGEETQEHIQTLNDGTHITQPVMRRTMYRDSLGRTRVERPLMGAPRSNANIPPPPTVIEITDPAAGVQFTLDTEHKIAHRATVTAQPSTGPLTQVARGGVLGTVGPNGRVAVGDYSSALPPPPTPPGSANAAQVRPPFPRPQIITEKLGTQVIDSVLAEGERQTITIPEGEQGNDRPLVTTTETWTSPDLKMVVLRKTNDPRSGESILKMSNLSRTEPDASLFQPPPDYTIVEETGQFTISYTN